jgi:hypothetical protein
LLVVDSPKKGLSYKQMNNRDAIISDESMYHEKKDEIRVFVINFFLFKPNHISGFLLGRYPQGTYCQQKYNNVEESIGGIV